MAWRARYLLIGGGALVAVGGLVAWYVLGGRGEVLKPDGGPVVTVMDFGQSFPLDPLPSGWATSEILDAFADEHGLRGQRRCAEHAVRDRRQRVDAVWSCDIDLAAYPMLAWRWYIELPARSPHDVRTREGDDHPARLFLRFATDRGEKRSMEVIWGNRLRAGDYKLSAASRTSLLTPARSGPAAGLTRRSTSRASARSGRTRRPRT